MRMQRRVFGRSIPWLPACGNHPAPDAMHIVIQVLLVAMLMTTVAYALKSDAIHENLAQCRRGLVR